MIARTVVAIPGCDFEYSFKERKKVACEGDLFSVGFPRVGRSLRGSLACHVGRFVRFLSGLIDLEANDDHIGHVARTAVVAQRDGLGDREAGDEEERTGFEVRETRRGRTVRVEVLERHVGVAEEPADRCFAGLRRRDGFDRE